MTAVYFVNSMVSMEKKIAISSAEDLESFHDDEDDEHDDNKQQQFLASTPITSNK